MLPNPFSGNVSRDVQRLRIKRMLTDDPKEKKRLFVEMLERHCFEPVVVPGRKVCGEFEIR